MKAEFKLTVDNQNTNVKVNMPEGVVDLDLSLMKGVIYIIEGVNKKIKSLVDRYYDENGTGVAEEVSEKLKELY